MICLSQGLLVVSLKTQLAVVHSFLSSDWKFKSLSLWNLWRSDQCFICTSYVIIWGQKRSCMFSLAGSLASEVCMLPFHRRSQCFSLLRYCVVFYDFSVLRISPRSLRMWVCCSVLDGHVIIKGYCLNIGCLRTPKGNWFLLFRYKKYANLGKLINVLACINAVFLFPLSKYFQVSFSLLMQELLSEFLWENELIYQDSCPVKEKHLHLLVISHYTSESVVVCSSLSKGLLYSSDIKGKYLPSSKGNLHPALSVCTEEIDRLCLLSLALGISTGYWLLPTILLGYKES